MSRDNLVPRALFPGYRTTDPASKAKEKRPGDEVGVARFVRKSTILAYALMFNMFRELLCNIAENEILKLTKQGRSQQ